MVDAETGARAEDGHAADQRGDVPHWMVPVGVLLVGHLQRLANAICQNQLIAGVGEGVHRLGEERMRTGVHPGEKLQHAVGGVSEK